MLQSAKVLIAKTVDDLKFDSSYLRVRSRDVLNDQDAVLLQQASEQIAKLTLRLEKLMRRAE
jgi:hypothetical protein